MKKYNSLRSMVLIGSGLVMTLAGCGPAADDCTGAIDCGSDTCVDVVTDVNHCGGCGLACNTGETCVASMCTVDNNPCVFGEMEACYTGPNGSENVGPCTAGTRTCGPQGNWGSCDGQVTPVPETCTNNVDDNCNGSTDEDVDADGDGVTTCGGDCCDSTNDGCTLPALVNPGAFDAINGLDDDCDGVIDNTAVACDASLLSNSADPLEYAAAMELCQAASPDRWGVVSAQLVLADGNSAPNPLSRSIRPDFGATMVQGGSNMVVFSTGHAADTSDVNPSFSPFEIGTGMFTTSQAPADWIAANGGSFPNAPGCPAALDTIANDSVMLQLEIKVPTNARSFSFLSNFFSSEYPEFVCTEYNDFFVALLDSTYSGMPANPADKNLARYTDSAMNDYPVGVNLAFGDTGLFRVCQSGPTGCAGGVPGTNSACTSAAGLSGTGFDLMSGGGCGTSTLDGGATGWLQTTGNVVGGETITLRIAVWDTSDNIYDSVVLIDNFQWSVDSADPGTVIVE